MIRRPIPNGCGRIAVLLMLTPMMMLNASQAMTLCVSQDGHVAIELLIGDHCTCEVRTAGADDAQVDTASRLLDERSQSCSDFVIPVGACGIRAARGTSTVISGIANAALSLPFATAIDALGIPSPEPPPAFSCYYTPLGSVILRV